MIISVCEQFHDYEPKVYFLNTDLLNANKIVDKHILDKIVSGEDAIKVYVNGSEECESPIHANVKSGPAEKVIYLKISFDD